jgi:hypothetical protein
LRYLTALVLRVFAALGRPCARPRLFDVRQVWMGSKAEDVDASEVNADQGLSRKSSPYAGYRKAFLTPRELHDRDELIYLSFHPF